MRHKKMLGWLKGATFRRYGSAVFLVCVVALGQTMLVPEIDGALTLPALVLAVMLAAFHSGGGPALLASILSVLIAAFFFLEPKGSILIADAYEAGLLAFVGLLCLVMSAMGALLHRSRRAASALTLSLEEREKTVRALLDSAPQAIFGIDTAGTIRFTNKAVSHVFGYRPEELIGRPSALLIADDAEEPGEDEEREDGALQTPRSSFVQHCLVAQAQGQELAGMKKDGTRFPLEASFSIADIPTGALVVTYVADLTERKRAAERALEAARHDHLTGLPNRALIYELGGQLLKLVARKNTGAAVLFFDLDRFKPVNDTYGHVVGDKMLKEVAARLRGAVRDSDLVGRLGGDEFLAVLSDVKTSADVLHSAGLLLARLGEPYRIESLELRTSPSIGISMYPTDGADLDTLIRHADAAMYHAKGLGRNNFQFFTPAINRNAEKAFALEQRMRKGVEQGEFELLYQPVVDTRSLQVVGAEALIRWRQDGAEPLLPGEFIAIAEASGMINRLGDWVLQEVCRQLEQWKGIGLPPLRVAINVSPLQFRASDFCQRMRETIERTGVDPASVELELTESTIMRHVEEASHTLADLKQLGLRIALDDFGTGYSSLSSLSALPIDKLKVDQSFIRHCDTDARSLAITETVVMLGKKLGVEVVAEGIESDDALATVRRCGCDFGQGYLISKPLSAEQFAQWYRHDNLRQTMH